MAALIDTNIAIHLQDGEPSVMLRVRDLEPSVSLSIVSRVELANGLRLVTINGADFRDIPGLQLEIWRSSAATPRPPSGAPR